MNKYENNNNDGEDNHNNEKIAPETPNNITEF